MANAQVNLEALRTMVVVITNDRSWTVKRDDSDITSSCDYSTKTITVTLKNVPRGLPGWKVEKMIDGVTAHEAGHVIVSTPYNPAYMAWMQMQKYPLLAKYIENLYEDLRVNFYVANRYRFDIGQRMEELHKAVTPSMVAYGKSLPLETQRLEKGVISLTLNVLADIDIADGLDSVAADNVRKAAEILKTAKFKRVTKDVIGAVAAAYEEMEKLAKQPKGSKKPKQPQEGDGSQDESEEGEGGQEDEPRQEETAGAEDWDGGDPDQFDRDADPEKIPNVIGGEFQLDATKEEIEAAMEEQRKMEEEAKKAAEELAKQLQQQGIASGITTGVEQPHPEPNPDMYRQLVQKNTPYISQLLNRLKSLQKVRWSTARYARRGRYMIEMHPLWSLLSKGRGKPFDRRFEGHEMHIDEVKCKIALLVDMSGSMDETQARDVLTIVSEVAGRWLPSSDFAVGVFGTDWSLVKAFVEPYMQARTRIGSVTCMGGTNLHEPLSIMLKMISSFRRSDYELILIIVSDFCQTDGKDEDTKKAIADAERMGIKVIGCGLCSSDLQLVRSFTTRATYVQNCYELPMLFFRVWRQTVSGRLK